MLDNIRRKSLAYKYFNLKHQISFSQGHVFYKNAFNAGKHRQRLTKKETGTSFQSTINLITTPFKLPFFLGIRKFNMIFCPKGTFIMGYSDQGDNKPRQEVIERAFLLGETEVTQELYQAVMGFNRSKYQNDSQNPVEKVSWFEAILFCNKLSELQGLDECYEIHEVCVDGDEEYDWSCDFSKNGYRLPREKEWEYAAKAGTNNKYAGTDKDADIGDYAVYYGNSKIDGTQQTHPVKSKKPNEWGFYDMSGNVLEWCWDKYDQDDPKPKAYRVYRGGCWVCHAPNLRSAFRSYESPGDCDDYVGFRVCRSIVN